MTDSLAVAVEVGGYTGGIEVTEIPGYETFNKIEPLDKGMSSDKKYRIETANGRRLLLRVTDIGEYDRKRAEYDMLKRVAELGLPVPHPLDFGKCNNGKCVYQLVTWIDGEDVESAIPHMSDTEQYSFGFKAGQLFRRIHLLPAPDDAESWGVRFRQKISTRIELYNKHQLQTENSEIIIRYLNEKQMFLDSRPQTFWHGDMNLGNHIIMPDGEIGAVDVNHWNLGYGDPWWEFVIIPWGQEPPAHYFTGMINGYFGNRPPHAFFEALTYYYACDALSALCYTFLGSEPYEPDDGNRHMENILRWFDNMQNPVPTWYLKNTGITYD